jgi:hypothetical protein
MRSGDTFLFADGREDDHLWMVISDTDQDPQRLVIVRFLSWQEKYDQACVLNGGEHPFVKHATCVDYPAARIALNTELEALKERGKLKLRSPLSAELLKPFAIAQSTATSSRNASRCWASRGSSTIRSLIAKVIQSSVLHLTARIATAIPAVVPSANHAANVPRFGDLRSRPGDAPAHRGVGSRSLRPRRDLLVERFP